MIDRRLFLLGGLAACSVPGDESGHGAANAQSTRRPPTAASGPALSPEQFGARGDGRSDDTAAIQACIDRAPAGGVVRLRRGAVYLVDTNRNPSWNRFGGLRMRPRLTLDLNGAELRALPSEYNAGGVVQAFRVDGWRIVGPGRITGERAVHRGRGGEWGMGIVVMSSSNWVVENVDITSCWGDGLYVGTPGTPGEFCTRFLIDQVRVHDCRRNGISITAGRDGEIRNARISKIDGTNPLGGIDLEPDQVGHPNRNIVIRGGATRDVGTGVYVTVANEGILITGMDIRGSNSGVLIGDNSRDVRVEDNDIVSTVGGQEGSALRTVSANPASIVGLQIRGNRLSGGGHVVIDIVGGGYRQLQIEGNRIEASNRGTLAVGRIGAGTFVDNEVIIGPSAGKANDFFLHLSGVTRGRNRYVNQSRFNMHNVILGGRDLGGEVYASPSLRALVERN